jgi:PAS domain S-box-containing protein
MPEDSSGLTASALDDAAVRVLASQLNLNAALFDALPEGIALYRKDGIAVTGNVAARTLVGRTVAELRDAHFTVHIAREGWIDVATYHRAVLETGENAEFPTTFLHADGTRVPVTVTLIPARYQGAIVGIYGIARPRAE